jgi:hypothetical protein
MLTLSMVVGLNLYMIVIMWNNHLKENKLGYWSHWWRAMKLSGALFIHAFLPDVLTDYASKELSDD